MIILLLPFISVLGHAQNSPVVPNEIKPLIEFMSVTQGDAKQVSLAKRPDGVDCVEEERSSKPIFFPGKTKDSEWSFTISTSITGPKGFEKKFPKVDPWGVIELQSITRVKYNSHEERMAAITNLCANKTEDERIKLGANFGGMLSSIYDNNRVNGTKIRPEDQWQALYERTASYNYEAVSGVCRDATFTLAQFLVACGFSKNQISIQSYETPGGGHQVVNVRNSKGELYTINWSELYSVNEKGGVASDLNPSNPSTGLDYYTYDADGKLVAFRRTELGNIIKAVSGGKVNDLDYQPHLLKLEANYGRFSGAIFAAETMSGESAQGIGVSFKLDEEGPHLFSVGTSFTKSVKDREDKIGSTLVEQNILYFQIEGGFKPKFTFNPRDNSTLIISPSLTTSTELYVTSSTVDKKEQHFDVEKNVTSQMGLEAEFRKGNVTSWAKASTDIATHHRGNTEATEKYSPIIFNTKNLAAGTRYDGEKYSVEGNINARFSYFEDSYSVSTSVTNHEARASASVMYKVYDRGMGYREDYVMIGGEKNFTLERVNRVSLGAQTQIPIGDNPNDPTYFATIKFKH